MHSEALLNSKAALEDAGCAALCWTESDGAAWQEEAFLEGDTGVAGERVCYNECVCVQGLGLYAARDIEKCTMVIEYIGTIIRSEVANRKERLYESQVTHTHTQGDTGDL